MKQVLPPEKTAAKVCGIQKVCSGLFRVSRYVFRVPYKDAVLLYHTLTCELVLLSVYEDELLRIHEAFIVDVSESAHTLYKNDQYRQLCTYLIMHWFMVPEHYNEYAYATQFRNIIKLLAPARTEITAFRIFTTTDCNARCSYCYEAGCSKIKMSVQTANNVVDYIQRVSCKKDIKITWFGGEPMMNPEAIDTICSGLRRRGIEYVSGMISNGSLFDKDSVKNAVEYWNLHHIQITLDGTEDVYNRSKGYINIDGSAFQRVLGNIDLLLSYGVDVRIRLNMSSWNLEDLNELIDVLNERICESNRPSVYVAQIKNYGFGRVDTASDNLQAEIDLSEKLADTGLLRKQRLPGNIRMHHCMADNDSAITITPDGRTGKCEHFFESHLIGNIYRDTVNSDEISYWKERIRIKECQSCVLYPSCTILKNCPTFRHGCTEYDRMRMEWILKCKILNEFTALCNIGVY